MQHGHCLQKRNSSLHFVSTRSSQPKVLLSIIGRYNVCCNFPRSNGALTDARDFAGYVITEYSKTEMAATLIYRIIPHGIEINFHACFLLFHQVKMTACLCCEWKWPLQITIENKSAILAFSFMSEPCAVSLAWWACPVTPAWTIVGLWSLQTNSARLWICSSIKWMWALNVHAWNLLFLLLLLSFFIYIIYFNTWNSCAGIWTEDWHECVVSSKLLAPLK